MLCVSGNVNERTGDVCGHRRGRHVQHGQVPREGGKGDTPHAKQQQSDVALGERQPGMKLNAAVANIDRELPWKSARRALRYDSTVVQKLLKTTDAHSGVEFPLERKRIRRRSGETSVARRVLQQRLQEVIASIIRDTRIFNACKRYIQY